MTRDGERGGVYDCKVCTLHYCDEDGARTWVGPDGKTQRSRGPAPEPIWRFERGWGLGDHATCPKLKMPENWGYLIALHAAWKLGTLHGSGGMTQQPATYVDAMTLIESERLKIEEHRLKEQQPV